MTGTASDKSGTSRVVPIEVVDGRIMLVDQRKLPEALERFDATGLDDMCFAIKEMVVRGAPAIGAAAALALACEGRRLASTCQSRADFLRRLAEARDKLQQTRPTAVNLRFDTQAVYERACRSPDEAVDRLAETLVAAAREILEAYRRTCLAIGRAGATLVGARASVLTHCNAGALATGYYGTALGVIRAAREAGASLTVYVDETRPRQQGSRLTAWELLADGITPVLITDSMAGHLMATGRVDLVVVGADRIAANGDTANKIGTYTLAVLAGAHGIPFYVAAPLSTVDPSIACGAQIPIEERDASEVTVIGGLAICPPGVKVWNPAFDVTPARLITAIITEAGILRPPYERSLAGAVSSRPQA